MTDTILNTNSLQETLLNLIRTEKVRVREINGEIRLTPVDENSFLGKDLASKHSRIDAEDKIHRLNALRGSGKDLELTVNSFIAMTHDEIELGD